MTLSIAKRADQWGDRLALVDPDGGREFSYAVLADRIETAAGRLAAWEIGPGDRVVVLAGNRVSTLAMLFAARRRGATLAPVSIRLDPGTVGSLVDRIDPALVVYEDDFADLRGDIARDSVSLQTYLDRAPLVDDQDERFRENNVAPLFLHTGGTTGTPKVVPISERQLEWNAITETVAWGLDETTVSVPVLPLFHTGGWNLLTLPTLYAGGTVVLPRAFEPGEVLGLIEDHGATQLFAVAAIYRSLADHPDFASTNLSSLAWAMSGGGPCPESVMEPFRERGIPFVQGYGLTEGGPNSLYLSPDRADRDAKADRVGRPFPDCDARLVDEDGRVVDGAGSGELELSGPVTADRYLATEDGTFGEDGWVATGDLAHRDTDGDYAIVGRVDNAFDSGGEVVYPERIEDVLSDHPDVQAVGVVPIPHDRWGRAPKAVVVGEVAAEDLDGFANERLADFEQPAEFTFKDALPETGPGKLDRDALAAEFGG
jgi:fatty-acyl-CoA synthase